MSHRIVYGHLVIRFPLEVLKAAQPDIGRYSDQFLLLELGGDNNMTTMHRGREVGSRRWILSALGDQCDIVRDACKSAAYCEGGGMRLSGERHTTPESYIRRVRNVLKDAISLSDATREFGFSLTATLSIDSSSERAKGWSHAIERLSTDVLRQEEGGMYRWDLFPLHDMNHAAHLFVRSHLDSSDPWNIAKVDGPTHEFDQVMKSHRLHQPALL